MKTLCYSVRLASMERISDKAYRATTFDGRADIIPASQVFGQDYSVIKSDAWWISAWILERKSLTFSRKKAIFFMEDGKMIPKVKVEHHVPDHRDPVDNTIEELAK